MTETTRPLSVLVPLIRRELAELAQDAICPYPRIGKLLIEAQRRVRQEGYRGGFQAWLHTHFSLSKRTAYGYMQIARTGNALHTLHGVVNPRRYLDDQAEVNRLRDVAEAIIESGFRALSFKCHPDQPGGSTEAMARLNRVRFALQRQVKRWLGTADRPRRVERF
jgi:hypothetical protein